MGGRLDVLPQLRLTTTEPVPRQQSVGRFFLPGLLGSVRSQSEERKIFRQVGGRRAYDTKIARLASNTNPNLLLLGYDKSAREVRNVCVVPKHFFVPEIIQRRKPLKETARRAGWVGSNILLDQVPAAGRIFVLRDGLPEPKDAILTKWQQTLFLRDQSVEARGWLLDVMKAVEAIGRSEFSLDDVYAFEHRLQLIYPNNNNVRPKIRQQLQVLRDSGYLDFIGRGQYRLRQDR